MHVVLSGADRGRDTPVLITEQKTIIYNVVIITYVTFLQNKITQWPVCCIESQKWLFASISNKSDVSEILLYTIKCITNRARQADLN